MAPKTQFSTYLVQPAELQSALSQESPSRIVPLCASWFLPNDALKRTGYQTYLKSRIPNALFFDLDKVKDPGSPWPHMLPSGPDFAKAMTGLGIRRSDTVVVYDTSELGIFSAPRVAFTFQVFGHPRIYVLNNFRKWVEDGLPLESGEPTTDRTSDREEYPVPAETGVRNRVVSFEELKKIVMDGGRDGEEMVQILDARSKGRFEGTDPEPRPGISSGHIPDSISLPLPLLLDPESKSILPADKLKEVFESKGLDSSKPVISSCGTGVMATVVDVALREAGYNQKTNRVYDGSWTEWASRVRPEEGLIKKSE